MSCFLLGSGRWQQCEALRETVSTASIPMLVTVVHPMLTSHAIPEAPGTIESLGMDTWSSHAHALLEPVGPRSVLWMRSTTAANIALSYICCLGREELWPPCAIDSWDDAALRRSAIPCGVQPPPHPEHTCEATKH